VTVDNMAQAVGTALVLLLFFGGIGVAVYLTTRGLDRAAQQYWPQADPGGEFAHLCSDQGRNGVSVCGRVVADYPQGWKARRRVNRMLVCGYCTDHVRRIRAAHRVGPVRNRPQGVRP
jgi:hypothetical protein